VVDFRKKLAEMRSRQLERVKNACLSRRMTSEELGMLVVQMFELVPGDPNDPIKDLQTTQLTQLADELEKDVPPKPSDGTQFTIQLNCPNQELLKCILIHTVSLLWHMDRIDVRLFDWKGKQISLEDFE
jgi:hypothetical protein